MKIAQEFASIAPVMASHIAKAIGDHDRGDEDGAVHPPRRPDHRSIFRETAIAPLTEGHVPRALLA